MKTAKIGFGVAICFVLHVAGCSDDDIPAASVDAAPSHADAALSYDAASPFDATSSDGPNVSGDIGTLQNDAADGSSASSDVDAFPSAADAATPPSDVAAPDAHVHETPGYARITIADGAEGRLRFYDVASASLMSEVLVLEDKARVYAGSGNRYVFALSDHATDDSKDRVYVVDTGLATIAHGGHDDLDLRPPRLVDLGTYAITGTDPVHFTSHDGLSAIFFDGDGTSTLIDEGNLRVLGPTTKFTVSSGRGHHGAAVAVDADHVLLTIPNADATQALPIGVAVVHRSGTVGQTFPSCPGLHGEASGDSLVAFGCTDGVLVLSQTPGDGGVTWTASKIANLVDGAVGLRVGTLASHHEIPWLLGNWGTDLVQVDPRTSSMTKLPLGLTGTTKVAQFGFDAHGERIVVLDSDGRLHALDLTGVPLSVLQVTSPIDTSNHGALAASFAAFDDQVYVSDPPIGKVHIVDLATSAIHSSIMVPGKPTKLAISTIRAQDH